MTHPIDGGAVPPTELHRPVRMRASDTDRHATVQVLQDAVARGLLTPAEGSDRMAVAFAAVHRVDLEPLTVDLPPAPPNPGHWRPQRGALPEQLRSALTAGGGRNRAAQLALALVLLILLLTLGTAMLHLLLDGGGPGPGSGGFGPGRGGFGPR